MSHSFIERYPNIVCNCMKLGRPVCQEVQLCCFAESFYSNERFLFKKKDYPERELYQSKDECFGRVEA